MTTAEANPTVPEASGTLLGHGDRGDARVSASFPDSRVDGAGASARRSVHSNTPHGADEALKQALVRALGMFQPLAEPTPWHQAEFARHPHIATTARSFGSAYSRSAGGDLRKAARALGCSVHAVGPDAIEQARGGEYVRGFYRGATRTIIVDRTLPASTQRWVIGHELGHAEHHRRGWTPGPGIYRHGAEENEVFANAFAYGFFAHRVTRRTTPAEQARTRRMARTDRAHRPHGRTDAR